MYGRSLFIGLLALMVAFSLPVSASEIVAVDDSHGLNDKDAIDAYEENGVTTAHVTAPALDLTVADTAADVGADDSPISDAGRSYLSVSYTNDKPVTVRLYLDPAYSNGVYVMEDEELVKGHGTADIDVAEEGEYLSVTLSFSEAGTKVVPLSYTRAKHYSVVDGMGSKFGGIDVGASEEWEYIDASALQGGNATFTVQTAEPDELVVEYRRTTDDGSEDWVSVPNDPDHSAPLFTMRKSGVDDAVYIVSESSDAPQTRYKLHRTFWDSFNFGLDGLSEMRDQMLADLKGLFGDF